MAAKKKTKAGYDFIVAELNKNPKISYADIVKKAKRKKLPVFPVVYGRAKAALGLVKVRPYGSKKKKAAAKKRGPGRPRKSSDLSGLGALEDIMRRFREQERDQARMRSALEKVRGIIDEVLG